MARSRSRRGEAEAEVPGDFAGEAAAAQVAHGAFSGGMAAQRLLVEDGRFLEEAEQGLVPVFTAASAASPFLARDLEADGAGEVLHRLREVDVLVVHQEAEGIAAGAAAEAVVELLLGVHREGRRLLVVEGAAGAVVLAGLLQLHPAVDHVDDVDPLEQVVQEVLRYAAGHQRGTGRWARGRAGGRCTAASRRGGP